MKIFERKIRVYFVLALSVLVMIFLLLFFLADTVRKKVFVEHAEFAVYDPASGTYSDFEAINASNIDLGFHSDTVLLSFLLPAHQGLGNRKLLEINNATFDYVGLYRPNSNGDLVQLERSEFSDNIIYPNYLFNFHDDGSPGGKFVLKLWGKEPFRFSVEILDEQMFFSKYSKNLLWLSLYMGLMLALFAYNFILFFMVKDKVYLYYCLYILMIFLAQISLLGFSLPLFFAGSKGIYNLSLIGFSALSGIFGVLFVQNFLKTNRFVPKLHKLLNFVALVYVLAFSMRLAGLVPLSYTLTDLGGLMVVFVVLSSAIRVAFKGYKPANYFLIAWAFFLLGLLLYILHNAGFVHLGAFPNTPMLVGTALEAILLSLALAYRINVLKKEKELEQTEKLRLLGEKESLILEQNVMLEQKVKQRTEELEDTLHNLQNTQIQLVNQEKMASLGQLTAGIAHEINNPINFVSSNISPLKRDIADILEIMEAYRKKGDEEFSIQTKNSLVKLEKDLEYHYLLEEIDQLLKGMEDGAKRTVEIVKGLRLFSRVDEQDVKKVDIHDGLDSTLILLNSSMQGKITVHREYGQIPKVECLAGKINQVFMNILNNAIQAMMEDGVHNPEPQIWLRTSLTEGMVKIEIQDNGPGIPEEIKQRIFEPFFTTKAVGKGTGLGLSIVYSIIENHKGEIKVVSEKGKGTNFIIKLPVLQNNG